MAPIAKLLGCRPRLPTHPHPGPPPSRGREGQSDRQAGEEMADFAAKRRADRPDALAPDGSEVRLLCATAGGSMALFTLAPRAVARAVAHRTVAELWYVVRGRGRIWRCAGEREDVAALAAGVSVAIAPGTQFQFRCDGATPLEIVAVTMPPWPGDGEARPVAGKWPATV